MRNLVKADFYKLQRSKAFWICTALGIAVGILMVVGMRAALNRALSNPNPDGEQAQMAKMAGQVNGVWILTQMLPRGFNLIFVGVFVAIFISSEFGYGTIKNTLSRGADRTKVFASKLLVCTVASLVMLFTFLATLVIAGSIVWGFDPQGTVTAGGFIGMIALQTLLMIAFTALFTFISMTIRSGGGSIATNIVSALMVSTLLGAINLLFSDKVDITQYWLTTAISNLATTTPVTSDVVRGIVVALVWGIASVVVGIVLFRKQDVK